MFPVAPSLFLLARLANPVVRLRAAFGALWARWPARWSLYGGVGRLFPYLFSLSLTRLYVLAKLVCW